MRNVITPNLIICGVFFSANGVADITPQNKSYTNIPYTTQSTVSAIFKDHTALTRNELDQLRGGFIDKSGFKISIGFEKVVVVNGKLQAKSKLYIPALSLNKSYKNGMKDLALAMDALHERLEDKDYKGNVTDSELTNVSDRIGGATATLNEQLTDSEKPTNAVNLTTGEKSGGDQYTDALLSMLNGSQSLLETSTPSSPVPINLNTVVQNSQDSSLIQSFQMLNIKIDNLGQYRSKSVNALMLPQIINSLR